MTTSQKTILALLSVAAFVLLIAVGFVGAQAYQTWAKQPLGPGLSVSTPWSLPATWTPSPGGPQQINSGSTLLPTLSFATNTPARVPLCGGPNTMNVLAIGTDSRVDSYKYGLADMIRVVRVDFVTPRVSVLEFPRDLWVEIPEISDNLNGQDHEKLNQAYLYGNPGDGFHYWDDPSAGPGLLARTLNLNFGVQLDHYVAVNMITFVKVVDAVGGIDVNLPDTVDGRTSDDKSKRLLFLEGKHHLNGTQALTLARIRIDGVFSRADNQNIVLCALRKKLASPDVVTKIPGLITSFQDNIQTDLSPEQISQLACLGTRLKPQNISLASFPDELFQQSRIYDPVFKKRVFVWDVDFNILRTYVTNFQSGTWPGISVPSVDTPDETYVCQ